jgi:ergothioneine biosynthesis protein EgtB
MNTQAKLLHARQETDRLFGLVHPDWLYERPIPERHRIAFYLGHLEAFDWNLLRPHMPGVAPFHVEFDRLFAFGIDPVEGGLPSDAPSDWPSLEEIGGYNQRVRQTLDESEHPAELVEMALEHRLMHAETLAYALHQLPLEGKLREPQAAAPRGEPVRQEMMEIPAGRATLGLPRSAAFGWDNEFDEHAVDVAPFAIQRYKVTNGDFLAFVEAGGYQKPSLWSAAGWHWKSERNIAGPAFWRRDGKEWRYRTMFDDIPMPLDWPVYVSHAEAAAYANWAGLRLPTEPEWHRAAYGAPGGAERQFPWGTDEPGPQHGYYGFARWDPSPVNAFPRGGSAFAVEGLLANGWEWTATPFAPFAGFQAHPSYEGYSSGFFDGRHYVLKGGSTRTAARMLRRSFRNWFQPHYQYVYAGFRCAKGF